MPRPPGPDDAAAAPPLRSCEDDATALPEKRRIKAPVDRRFGVSLGMQPLDDVQSVVAEHENAAAAAYAVSVILRGEQVFDPPFAHPGALYGPGRALQRYREGQQPARSQHAPDLAESLPVVGDMLED